MMKIIAAIILGLALGWTTTALASPIQQNTNQDRIAALEARLQALEYLRWTENHAINAMSQRVWERYSSCNPDSYWPCHSNDLVLMPFTTAKDHNGNSHYGFADVLAGRANSGAWYAQDNGDGDSWNVWVIITIPDGKGYQTTYGPITWTVWQSNGFIRGVY
jgi:hypothetical protein